MCVSKLRPRAQRDAGSTPAFQPGNCHWVFIFSSHRAVGITPASLKRELLNMERAMITMNLDVTTVRPRRVLRLAALIGSAAVGIVIGLLTAGTFFSAATGPKAGVSLNEPVAALEPVTFEICPPPSLKRRLCSLVLETAAPDITPNDRFNECGRIELELIFRRADAGFVAPRLAWRHARKAASSAADHIAYGRHPSDLQ